MKACVWDVDGTLIDSYPVIAGHLHESLVRRGVDMTEEDVMNAIKEHSVAWLLDKLNKSCGLDAEDVDREYSTLQKGELSKIPLIDGASETIEKLGSMGIQNYVITHRGRNVYSIFEHLGIAGMFADIITREDGFKRKPDPESMYHLLTKYGLDPGEVLYIGDRRLDIDFAHNSGVLPVLLSDDDKFCADAEYDFLRVASLYEVPNLLADFGK